jgi:hypothetical protein
MAFVLWPNIILVVCVGIVLSIIGFAVYGTIAGFENTLKEFENHELRCETEVEEHCRIVEKKDDDN